MFELISALYQTVYDGASRVVKKVQKTLPCYIPKKKSGTVSDTAPDFILSVVQTFG